MWESFDTIFFPIIKLCFIYRKCLGLDRESYNTCDSVSRITCVNKLESISQNCGWVLSTVFQERFGWNVILEEGLNLQRCCSVERRNHMGIFLPLLHGVFERYVLCHKYFSNETFTKEIQINENRVLGLKRTWIKLVWLYDIRTWPWWPSL